MIVTVTVNPALDLTYAVGSLIPHGTHRVSAVAERPGGKGLNVARVLHALGEPVLATGLLGGGTGDRIAALIRAEGVPASFVPIDGETRRTVAVVDPRDATGFWEPGPRVTAAEWARFAAHFRDLLDGAAVVALSGSLPPGVPTDAYATLVRLAAAAGVPTVLDTSGEALRHGLRAAPTLAKPNADELTALVGGTADLVSAVRALSTGTALVGPTADLVGAVRALTTGTVVVSRGADGLLAIGGADVWTCAPPVPVVGNPTGAGDACVAALARGLRDRAPMADMLADAVALSAAAVAAPVAGAVDLDLYQQMTRA